MKKIVNTFAAVCLALFFATSSILLFCIPKLEAGERFHLRGCEFSVEFPGKPKIYDVIIPPIGKVQTAEFQVGSGRASDSYLVPILKPRGALGTLFLRML